MKPKRDVRIELSVHGTCWFVHYCDRKKGQRYSAAGFDARDNSRAYVEAWVKKQPHLNLVK